MENLSYTGSNTLNYIMSQTFVTNVITTIFIHFYKRYNRPLYAASIIRKSHGLRTKTN